MEMRRAHLYKMVFVGSCGWLAELHVDVRSAQVIWTFLQQLPEACHKQYTMYKMRFLVQVYLTCACKFVQLQLLR